MTKFKESDRLAFATGYCIFGWAKVEVALYALFSSLFYTSDIPPAVAVWDAILSFKDKLKATDGAFIAAFGVYPKQQGLVDIWKELADIVASQSKLRNEVAHSTLKPVRGKDRLVPYFSFSNPHAQGLTVPMIEWRTKQFERTAAAIFWLRSHTGQLTGQIVKGVVPEPPLIQELRQKIQTRTKPRTRP